MGAPVGHDDGALRGVGPLRVYPPMASRAALLGGAVVGMRIDQRHEPPRTVDPHLAGGFVGSRHGGQVPRRANCRQRATDTVRGERARPAGAGTGSWLHPEFVTADRTQAAVEQPSCRAATEALAEQVRGCRHEG